MPRYTRRAGRRAWSRLRLGRGGPVQVDGRALRSRPIDLFDPRDGGQTPDHLGGGHSASQNSLGVLSQRGWKRRVGRKKLGPTDGRDQAIVDLVLGRPAGQEYALEARPLE